MLAVYDLQKERGFGEAEEIAMHRSEEGSETRS